MILSLQRGIWDYWEHLVAFRPNARLYLVYAIIAGAAIGIFRLLFNFYVLSMGFDEKLLGNLVTTSSITALIVALPMGYLADVLGRKSSLLLSGVILCLSIAMMVIWPVPGMLYAMNVF